MVDSFFSLPLSIVEREEKEMQGLCDFSNKKSERHLLIGDQHKTSHPEGWVFTRMDELAYDLEPIVPGAGQRKAKGTC
jgi:hypothetical protein